LDKEERLLIAQGKAPLEQDQLRIDVSKGEEGKGKEVEEDRDASDVESVISRQSGRTTIIKNYDFVRI